MGSKQIITDCSLPEPDRISDLPSDIINFILDRLSIRDSVATSSILSKGWRHKWRRTGNLIFDEEFLGDVISPSMQGDDERMDLEYTNIVRRILLLHLGPVCKVVLHIPYFAHTLPSEFLSSMMLFISRTEVKELIIVDHYSPKFRLPSDIFHCNELQHLKLDVRTLDLLPPHDFGGFCNLISLDLCVSEDEGVIGNLISKCPLLERLSLECTACRHPLVIDAPRLRILNVFIGIDSDVNQMLCSAADISFDFGGGDVMDFCNLISIFGSVPKVDTVFLYLPPTLAVTDMPPDAPMSLPTTLYNHKSLTLLRVDISSPECIYFVLCVLKSSPNLQMLNLWVIDIPPSETSEDEAALHFLNMQTRKIEALKSLVTVKIKGLLGSKTGLMFIKMILSCSPILKTMYLRGYRTLYSRLGKDTHNEAEFTLMSELLQCPRASSGAQITEMGSSQGKIADTSLPDRISDLPSNIIDCILDRLPIRDTIATSVLCKESRHMWRRIPNLVFDKEFVDDVICRRTRGQGEPAMKHEYSNIIGKILLLHLGPIHKFVLHIPYCFEGKSLLDLSSWMLFISQNDVKEIIIEDKYTPKFGLPIYVFQCNELQHLKLDVRALVFHPPREFRGFCNLLSLDLSPVGLPLIIDAPRLRFLCAYFFSDASFELENEIPQDPLTSIPTTLHNLKNLTLLDTCISSLAPILCILQSTPNLRMLNVGISSSAISVDEAALHILDQIREPRTLNSLLAVNIEGLFGSKVEIMFIKLILSCSPVLKTLHLTGAEHLTAVMPLTASESFHSEAEFTFISELLQWPRSSCQAQVIYSKVKTSQGTQGPLYESLFPF
ncbi:unnamed protein product [Rhodiola kirilowii]